MTDKAIFAEIVYEVVSQIPPGKVTSYGAIARHIGMARSSRLVGWILGRSIFSKQIIPAHRVVNRNGLLTGKHHFENEDTMAEMLREEGIIVINDQIIDFKNYFWDPSATLYK
jgi:methylated-DNA-protein-cysteine methyltransferase-like protein